MTRTFVCPIDGAELADGKPCKEHGIAFSAEAIERPGARIVAAAGPLSRATTAEDVPAPRKRGKARAG